MSGFLGINLLVLCTLVLAFLLGLLLLTRRIMRRPVRVPSCRNCRYPIEGLPGDTCPECGGNLKQVGIIQPGDASPLARWQVALIWLLMYPVIGIVGGVLLFEALNDMTTVSRISATMSRPISGAYDSVKLDIPPTGQPVRANNIDAAIAITTDNGVITMTAYDDNHRYSYREPDGTSTEVAEPLTADAIVDVAEQHGLDVSDDRIVDEMQQVIDRLDAAINPGKTTKSAGSVSFDFSLSTNPRGGFSLKNESATTSSVPVRPWLAEVIFGGVITLAVIGLIIVLLAHHHVRRSNLITNTD